MQDLLAVTNNWVWVDYAIAAILGIFAFFGLLRGLIREGFTLIIWMIAIWVTMQYSHDFSALFQTKIAQPSLRIGVSCVVLFLTTLILGGIINALVIQLLQKAALSGGDRLLGMGLGAIRGALLISLLIMLAGFTHLPDGRWWKQSQLIPHFQSLAAWLKELIPSNVTAYLNSR